LHKVMTLDCNMMVRSLRSMTKKARDLLTYDGLTMVDEFLRKFEITILEQQQFDALKWVLRTKPT